MANYSRPRAVIVVTSAGLTFAELGRAKRVTIDKNNTTIIEGEVTAVRAPHRASRQRVCLLLVI